MSSINTDNTVNFFSDSAGVSVNSEDLEEVSINNDNLEDISNNEDDVPKNDDDFSQNDDYNPSTQKMADEPEPFQLFDGEYGPYFANFTKQMLFL